MTAKIRKQASGLRYVAALMGTFGFFALALAAVGVYAYSVNERRHEIGFAWRSAPGVRTCSAI
jgi:hypothetical protein